MHLTLESLNHILTVIAVTAFLFSRKDFFQVLFESNLLPTDEVKEDIKVIFKELETKINASMPSTSLIGFDSPIVDIDNPSVTQLLKLKALIITLNKGYRKDVSSLKKQQQLFINTINNRFKNTSFYISLLSFFFLILAAYESHHTTTRLNVFLFVFNFINVYFLCVFTLTKKEISNLKVLKSFCHACIASMVVILFPSISNKIYDLIYSFGALHLPILDDALIMCQPNGFYHILLSITLFTILSPWIICFIRFSMVRQSMRNQLETIKSPILEKLQGYSSFIDTIQALETTP